MEFSFEEMSLPLTGTDWSALDFKVATGFPIKA
jgi:hypothetical protein